MGWWTCSVVRGVLGFWLIGPLFGCCMSMRRCMPIFILCFCFRCIVFHHSMAYITPSTSYWTASNTASSVESTHSRFGFRCDLEFPTFSFSTSGYPTTTISASNVTNASQKNISRRCRDDCVHQTSCTTGHLRCVNTNGCQNSQGQCLPSSPHQMDLETAAGALLDVGITYDQFKAAYVCCVSAHLA